MKARAHNQGLRVTSGSQARIFNPPTSFAPPAGGGITILNAAGGSVSVPLAILNAAGSSITIPAQALNAAGTPVNL